jgi:uncharacterized hydantoinase/oxoprolinase family protein
MLSQKTKQLHVIFSSTKQFMDVLAIINESDYTIDFCPDGLAEDAKALILHLLRLPGTDFVDIIGINLSCHC